MFYYFNDKIFTKYIYAGLVAVLTAAINAWKGPWLSGAFGRELGEALAFISAHMEPSHALLAGELANVLLDRDLPADADEWSTPEAQLKLLLESPCTLREGTWVTS